MIVAVIIARDKPITLRSRDGSEVIVLDPGAKLELSLEMARTLGLVYEPTAAD